MFRGVIALYRGELIAMDELEKTNIESQIRHRLAQEYNWEMQKKHWRIIAALGALAILINGIKLIWEQ